MDTLFDAFCGTAPGGCDTLGMLFAALLTILVLSYLARDTFLFRLAQSLLVGTAIGYGSAVILRNVLWQQLLVPLTTDTSGDMLVMLSLLIPLIGGIFLLAKLVPNWGGLGNISLGFLFGIGAALAIGGALNGALAPQLNATAASLSPGVGAGAWINNFLIAVGALGAFLAFRFTTGFAGRPLSLYSTVANAWGRVGRAFIMIAFGAIFANILTARISTLVGVLYFLVHDLPAALIK